MKKPQIFGSVVLAILVMVGTTIMLTVQSTYGVKGATGIDRTDSLFGALDNQRKGSFQGGTQSAISGDNVYLVWFSNKTGDWEALFRGSSDGGTTFGDKINLSNTTDADSTDTEIAADGDNVMVSWWERNQTSEEPVARISIDNGATFGPLLKLSTNGTIGQAAE